MMTGRTVLVLVLSLVSWLLCLSGAMAGSEQNGAAIPAEDYALYDQVVTSKFLTSATRLVVIERLTRFRLAPDQEVAPTVESFREGGYFGDELPGELIRESSCSIGSRAGSQEDFISASVTGSSRRGGSKSRKCLWLARSQ